MDNRGTADIVLDRFEWAEIRRHAKVPIITIYTSPEDYPDKFVARLWDLDKPTPYIAVADTMDAARAAVPTEVMIPFQRDPRDDACITETWI